MFLWANGYWVAECSLLHTAGIGTKHLCAALAEHRPLLVHGAAKSPSVLHPQVRVVWLSAAPGAGTGVGMTREGAGGRPFCCLDGTKELSSRVAGQDLCGWRGPLPGVACHLLANPMGRMEPRRELEKESSCGLVVSF